MGDVSDAGWKYARLIANPVWLEPGLVEISLERARLRSHVRAGSGATVLGLRGRCVWAVTMNVSWLFALQTQTISHAALVLIRR
jgi:hypothetical protein